MKYVITATLTLLLLVGCVAEGETFVEKQDTSPNAEPSITERFISKVADPLIETALTGIGGQDEKDYLNILLQILNESRVEQSTENTFFTVKYLDNYDGDTYRFKIESAYQLTQDPNTLKNSITLLKLSDFGFTAGEEIKVRALLIDSPEIKDKETGKPQAYAKESREYAAKLLKNADTIVVAYDIGEKQDRYNRHLMYVWVDAELLSVKLLEKGYAKVAYVNEPNTTYLDEYRKAEQKAVEHKLGIWNIH